MFCCVILSWHLSCRNNNFGDGDANGVLCSQGDSIWFTVLFYFNRVSDGLSTIRQVCLLKIFVGSLNLK